VQLAFDTAAFWLMHGVRGRDSAERSARKAEFATTGERLIKIGVRDRALRTHPHPTADELPRGRCSAARARPHAIILEAYSQEMPSRRQS
jgi:hypothetical protein